MSAETAWFKDETSLIAELRDEVQGAPPPVIDGYSDLRELRRGGQGVVYIATQLSTSRRVAVKVLLDHALADLPRSRFQREIDLVASFQHPGIVRLFDSGLTAEQRPYLVMELIDGLPLHEYIATARPSTRQIVQLFLQITETVSYAHQRGVIHRDLKPGNIRISADGKPHILDFGLAKIIAAPLDAPRRSLSISGQFLGSLPWASPEQADGRTNHVDVRSDIYSIGVMLYEALTGDQPYDTSGPITQTLNNILEAQPPRPSARNRHLNRDLDTIILKALAKDADRRYQSAEALAGALANYLADEPIQARRDSTWYVMAKTARKHRALVAVGVIGLAALVSFTIILAVLYQRALASEQLAEQRRQLAQHESERAQQRFDDVRELANRFMFDVHDELQDLAGSRPAREMLVHTAQQYLTSLAAETADDPDLMLELAAAYKRLGDLQGNPYRANLGDTEGTLQSYQQALQLRQGALALRPDDGAIQRAIADTLNSIGEIHLWAGRRDQALQSYNESAAMLKQLLVNEPDNAGAKRVLAATHINTGDLLLQVSDTDGMLESYRAGLSIIEQLADADPDNTRDQLNLAVCHSKIGFAISYTGDHEQALAHLQTALAINQQLADADPDNATVSRGVSIGANQVGAALVALQRFDEAITYYDRSLAIAEELHHADPEDTLAASDLAFTRNKIGELHSALGRYAQAAEQYRIALALRQQLTANDPANASFQRDLAISHWLIASTHEKLAFDESLPVPDRAEHCRQAIEHLSHCRDTFIGLRQRGAIMETDKDQPEQLQLAIEAFEDQLELLQADAGQRQ